MRHWLVAVSEPLMAPLLAPSALGPIAFKVVLGWCIRPQHLSLLWLRRCASQAARYLVKVACDPIEQPAVAPARCDE